MEKEYSGVANFQVEALVENELTLLYKVTPGACDKSFGIYIAQLAQFPEVVIQVDSFTTVITI